MRLFELLVESFPDAKREFKAHTSEEEVNNYINKYRNLIKRNLIKDLKEKDINTWRKAGWDKFKKYIDEFEGTRSKTAIKRKRAVNKKVITLVDDNKWEIVIPLNHTTSCNLGKDTNWCTAKPHTTHFSDYLYNLNMIIVYMRNKETGGQWGVSLYPIQDDDGNYMYEIYNKENKFVSGNQFKQDTGFTIEHIMQMVNKRDDEIRAKIKGLQGEDPQHIIAKAITDNDSSETTKRKILNIFGLEKLKYAYVTKVLNHRWPEMEKQLIKDPEIAFYYARDFLHGRWPEAEKTIMLDKAIAAKYKEEVMDKE